MFPQWLKDIWGTGGTTRVTAETTLQSPAYWYGINKISGNLGTLPLNVMRSLDPGAEKMKNHIGWRLMRKRPNAYQTPFVFKQTETARAILWGNSRSYIHRAGQSSELIPLRPDATITGMIEGEVWHCTKPQKDERILTFDNLLDEMMETPDKVVMIPDRDCLHVKGFGDGINGLSLFKVARTTLETSLGADKRAARQQSKGFAGKVMLEAPADSPMGRDEQKAAEFLADFQQKHGEDGSADAIGLLRGGIKANVLQMSNRDAEFIEQQKFGLVQAGLFLMLESILGYDNSVSYNSEEQKQLAYLKNCLSNWLVRWEEECNFKLLSRSQFFGDYYFKFNTGTLLRTDTATTMDTLSKGIASRIYSPNDAREKLDENPYPGGSEYFNPAITPGNGQGQEEPETEEEPQANAAMIAHLEHLMNVEAKQVNKRLKRGETQAQLDDWYDDWSITLGDAIEKLGGDRIIAQTHCVQNLKFLQRKPDVFDLTGTAELLAKEINSCLI